MNEFEPIIQPKIIGILKEERRRYTDIEEYLGEIIADYGDDIWLEQMRNLAFIVEPRDVVLGSNPEKPAANAFYRGAILGFRVVKECGNQELEKKMLQINIGLNNDDPDYHNKMHTAATSIVNLGQINLFKHQELAKLILDWEDELEPEEIYQPFVRSGFGIMMHLLYEANELLKTEQLQAAISAHIDWDLELQNLIAEE